MEEYQKLFDHMSNEHGLTLLQSEMQEIIDIVREMDGGNEETPTAENKECGCENPESCDCYLEENFTFYP